MWTGWCDDMPHGNSFNGVATKRPVTETLLFEYDESQYNKFVSTLQDNLGNISHSMPFPKSLYWLSCCCHIVVEITYQVLSYKQPLFNKIAT